MEFISLPQFLWQLANFLLFFFVVSRYVVPPVQKMITKRQHEINEGLEFAQKAKKELEQSEAQRAEILKTARSEANTIVEEAKKRSETLIEEAKTKARSAAEVEAAQVHTRAQEQAQKRMSEIDREVIELALAVLEKSFKHTLGSSHELVKKEVSQLSKVKEYVA